MNRKLVCSIGLFLLSVTAIFALENQVQVANDPTLGSQPLCKNCIKDSSNRLTKLKAWMSSKEENQGRNFSGPRTQGVRPTPLYKYFQQPCSEKLGTSSSNGNQNWSPTSWRNFTSTGNRMFDTPTQYGVGSGQSTR